MSIGVQEVCADAKPLKTFYISTYKSNGYCRHKETLLYKAKNEKDAFMQALGCMPESSKVVISETMGKYVWDERSSIVLATIERMDDETGHIVYMAQYSHE